VDRLAEITRRAELTNSLPQNIAGLLFHRAAVLGRPHTQATFHIIVKVPNRYAGHGTFQLLFADYALIAIQSRLRCF
jgi:hypothetical protein